MLRRCLVSCLAGVLVWFVLVAVASAIDIPDPLPDPDGRPADQTRPVKVFILMGQSNMLGFGRVGPVDQKGTLEYLVKKQGKYPFLVDAEGNWTERRDVRYVQVMTTRERGMQVLRNEWLTVRGRHIGPELGFGHVIGYVLDEPVLLIKSCIGNRSLGWDLLPPGSKRFTYQGRVYAGYRDTPESWVEGEPKRKVNWYAGLQYDMDVSSAKAVLSRIREFYPGYRNQGYEVAGFVFWQGHKDQNPVYASRYELNLVNFIRALRKDFNAPNAKFVLATIAFGGWKLSGPGLTVANAQLAVDGDRGKYPEFKGNVKTVEARDFWRPAEVSPSRAGYHYNHNAETYMEVGLALGRAMAELLERDEGGSR